MKRFALIFLLMTTFAQAGVFAQDDDDLIEHEVEDGSLTLMIPDGWHVDEDLGIVPTLTITNNEDLLSLDTFPDELDEETYILVILAVNAAMAELLFPDINIDAPFEDIANEMFDSLADPTNEEMGIALHEISFETFGEDEHDIALAEVAFGEADGFITVHQVEEGLVISMNLAASGDGDALRDWVMKIVPTLEFVNVEREN